MNKKIIEDEIDLLGLIVTVWENQLKIYIITVITLIISLGYYSSQNSLGKGEFQLWREKLKKSYIKFVFN